MDLGLETMKQAELELCVQVATAMDPTTKEITTATGRFKRAFPTLQFYIQQRIYKDKMVARHFYQDATFIRVVSGAQLLMQGGHELPALLKDLVKQMKQTNKGPGKTDRKIQVLDKALEEIIKIDTEEGKQAKTAAMELALQNLERVKKHPATSEERKRQCVEMINKIRVAKRAKTEDREQLNQWQTE